MLSRIVVVSAWVALFISLQGVAERPSGDAFGWDVAPTQGGMHLSCTFSGAAMEEVQVEGHAFVRMRASDLGVEGRLGQPEIPVWRRLVAAPEDAVGGEVRDIKTDATQAKRTALHLAAPLYPVQPPREKTPDAKMPPLAWDKAFYAAKGNAAPETVSLTYYGVQRRQRLYLLTVRPVQYDPATQAVSTHRQIDFDIVWQRSTRKSVSSDSRYGAAAFQSMYADQILTTPEVKLWATDAPTGYLIIAAAAFMENALLDEFVTWKRARGFITTLVSTDTTGTTMTSIRDYIQQAYETWDTPPAFVLLVGDTDTIPHAIGGGEGDPPTDLVYSTVDGTEYYTPDLWCGRFPVRTEAELNNILSKTLDYEFARWESTSTWETHSIFMAGIDHYELTEGTHNDSIATYLIPRNYTADKWYTKTYGATTAQVRVSANEGAALMVYSGHGGRTAWIDGPPFSQQEVRNLSNAVYPLVASFACTTGDYTLEECFAETWLREEHGAWAFIGSSVNSYWSQDDALERAWFESVYTDGYHWAGGMLNHAKAGFATRMGYNATTQRYFEMYNLMGDPSVVLYTTPVQSLSVEHLSAIPIGSTVFPVSVEDGATVAITVDGVLYGIAQSHNGVASVPLSKPVQEGEATITITAPNRIPYQTTLPVLLGSDGNVLLDEAIYTCPADVSITLTDLDLLNDDSVGVVLSTTSGDTELVSLANTDTFGVFESSISLQCATSYIPMDGVLQVQHGDQITVTYQDADTGEGSATKTDTALVDAVAPTVTFADAVRTESTQVEIEVHLSEEGTVELYCGEVCGGTWPLSTHSNTAATVHTLNFSGLTPFKPYYYTVVATDYAGNTSEELPCQFFITEQRPDYFTQEFVNTDKDLQQWSLTFTPDESKSFYTACATEVDAFPVTVDGSHMILALNDDTTQEVALRFGKTLPFYGVSYSQIHINANGNITFLRGDTEYKANFSSHFAQPRVAGFFTDLNPAESGTISYKQFAEQMVVTYDSVRALNSSYTVSFQVQFFFDGRVCITWLGIGAQKGIAGLSAGDGIPIDFAESMLYEYPLCSSLPEGEEEAPTTFRYTLATSNTLYRYTPGETLDVTLNWQKTGPQPLNALTFTQEIPTGWTFVALVDDAQFPSGSTAPAAGDSGTLQFVFGDDIADAGSLTYRLQAPTGGARVALSAQASYTLGEEEQATAASVYPLYTDTDNCTHSADQDQDFHISLSELLRCIQFFNLNEYHCETTSEDGYAPGEGDQKCTRHAGDYTDPAWKINLTELLRLIQLYNSHGYHPCDGGEDSFCSGLTE